MGGTPVRSPARRSGLSHLTPLSPVSTAKEEGGLRRSQAMSQEEAAAFASALEDPIAACRAQQ